MFSQSVIDTATVEAYRQTDYRVLGATPCTLRIGQFSVDLLAAHKRHRVDCSAFITACNPLSQTLDAAANASRQEALRQELLRLGLPFDPGIGQHPDNGWPGEESFLAYGLSLEATRALGQRHAQNAIVWSDSDATPQLILLR